MSFLGAAQRTGRSATGPLRRTRVHVLCQERTNVSGDHLEILLESEVARVKEMELKVLQVSLVRLGARRGEDSRFL